MARLTISFGPVRDASRMTVDRQSHLALVQRNDDGSVTIDCDDAAIPQVCEVLLRSLQGDVAQASAVRGDA